jgi:arabinogalactan oligomer/maltooligosaccharide transport system permease protein
LPVGLKKYVFDFKTQWQLVSAAAVMVTFPVLAIWLRVQTALMSGKLSGSVKG